MTAFRENIVSFSSQDDLKKHHFAVYWHAFLYL